MAQPANRQQGEPGLPPLRPEEEIDVIPYATPERDRYTGGLRLFFTTARTPCGIFVIREIAHEISCRVTPQPGVFLV
jgi:hypothetical protein